MRYARYHELGNDYLVVDPAELNAAPTPDLVRLLCDRHTGIDSDGLLLGPLPSGTSNCRLRIFNPDGSEAEKSGNGLRIFARWRWDEKRVGGLPFTVETVGGEVLCHVKNSGRSVADEMGSVSFLSTEIPVAGLPREVLGESLKIDGHVVEYCAATIGNPHCVVLCDDPTPEMAVRLGPRFETDPRFPHGTNVQFMRVVDRSNIRIQIWERGAGHTLASGSSSTAAAAVAHRLGLCSAQIAVHMPGRQIEILLGNGFHATMTGPASKICQGTVAEDLLVKLRPI